MSPIPVSLPGLPRRLRLRLGAVPELRKEMEAALAGPKWAAMARGSAPTPDALQVRRVDDDEVPEEFLREHLGPELLTRRVTMRGRDGRPTLPRIVTNETRGSRCLHVADAIVTSGWDFVRFGEFGLLPGLSRSTEWLLRISDFSGTAPPADLLMGWSDDEFFLRPHAPTREFAAAVCLFGHFMSQWGHVTYDLLPRVIGHEHELAAHPVLLQEGTPTNFLDILRRLVPGIHVELIPKGETVLVHRMIMPLPRLFYPAYWRHDVDVHWPIHRAWATDHPAFREIRDRLALPPAPSRTNRIHLLRHGGANAPVKNADEVRSLLATLDFREVVIEDLTVDEVRELLAETRIVAAARGSNLVNLLLLAPPGLEVIIYGAGDRKLRGSGYRAMGHRLTRLHGPRDWPLDSSRLTFHDIKQLPTSTGLRRLRWAALRAIRRTSPRTAGRIRHASRRPGRGGP